MIGLYFARLIGLRLRIEGYAAVFHAKDLQGDIILPGAFAKSLDRKPVSRVRFLLGHASQYIAGTIRSLEEDRRGLRVVADIDPVLAAGRIAWPVVKSGEIDGLSIGFKVNSCAHEKGTRVRTISEIDLWEVSLVAFPAQPWARVERIKRVHAARCEA
jgi:uncharacterized protein